MTKYFTGMFCPIVRRIFLVITAAAASALPQTTLVVPAFAATEVANLNVQLVIQDSCDIDSVGTMDFGSTVALLSIATATADILVTCTDTTPYSIELDAGAGVGATTTLRKMSNGANTVDYTLYQEGSHINLWGTGVNNVSGTGDATQQTHTIYGLVPIQVAPVPGTYSDTVVVTITY